MDGPGENAGCRNVSSTCPPAPTASPMKSRVLSTFGVDGTAKLLIGPSCEFSSSSAPLTANPTTWRELSLPLLKLSQTVLPPLTPGPVAIAG